MNLSDLVERYFEEVQSTPSVQDDELERTLVAAGADVLTARRIIVFAPLASARVWFRSARVSFTATFGWHGEGVDNARVDVLADEPVFIEALLATERRGLSRSQAVVERSSTFRGLSRIPLEHEAHVGKALLPADYLNPPGHSPTQTWTTSETGVLALLAPESESVTSELNEVLRTRGVLPADNSLPTDWTRVTTAPPAWQFWRRRPSRPTLRAQVWARHAMPSQVRLVLRVEIESKQGVIADSVHASGETTALALANGVELIVQTSLDPLLAVFPKKTPSAGEVERQSLVGKARGWSVCRGRLFAPGLPEPAFDTQELWNGLLERFLATKPSPALHTIRWRIGAGRPSDSEMLLDDQPWAAGKASLDDWALLRHSDDGAVHQFGLVGPTSRSRK